MLRLVRNVGRSRLPLTTVARVSANRGQVGADRSNCRGLAGGIATLFGRERLAVDMTYLDRQLADVDGRDGAGRGPRHVLLPELQGAVLEANGEEGADVVDGRGRHAEEPS